MPVVSSFPILRLPLVALNEVLNHMNSVGLLLFLLASKKTTGFMKRRHVFHLTLAGNALVLYYYYQNHYYQFLCIFTSLNTNQSQATKMLKFENSNISAVIHNDRLIETFWDDQMEGYRKIKTMLCALFNIQTFCMRLEEEEPDGIIFRMLGYIQELQMEGNHKITTIVIRNDGLSDESIRYILDNINDIPKIAIDAYPSHEFRYETTRLFATEYCCIFNAWWMTLKDLYLLMDCKSIQLHSLKLTENELNSFLKKWQLETSKLVKIDLRVMKINILEAIQGLSATIENKPLVYNGLTVETSACYSICGNNGVKSMIWIWEEDFVMHTDK